MTPGTSTSRWARRRPCAAASGLGLPRENQFHLLAPFFTEYTYFITGNGGEPVVSLRTTPPFSPTWAPWSGPSPPTPKR